MENNNTFSFTRFGLLFRKDIVENKNLYLLGALVIFGILVILITIFGLDQAYRYVKYGTYLSIYFDFFFFFMVAFSLIFASVVFSRMNTKAKRIAEIVLPASALEKFIVKWLIVVVLFTFAYIILFFSAKYVSSLIVKLFYPEVPMIGLELIGANTLLTNVVAYLLLQSFYIWGAVVMPKLSFVKISVLLFICMLVYYIYYCLLGIVVGELFYLRQAGTICDGRIIFSAITVMLWGLAYFRYKEETVNYKLL